MNSINGQDQLADDLYGNWSGGIHAVASHSNYIGKLLESIVRDSLLTHFNTHDLLSNNQHPWKINYYLYWTIRPEL